MQIEAYFDGLCEPNSNGVATYGFVIYKNKKKIYNESGLATTPYTKQSTNNYAEYTACLKALEYLVSKDMTSKVVIRGDSQLVINQVNRKYKIRSENIVKLYQKVSQIFFKFKSIRFEWVPRGQNKVADQLATNAYKKFIQRGGSSKPFAADQCQEDPQKPPGLFDHSV